MSSDECAFWNDLRKKDSKTADYNLKEKRERHMLIILNDTQYFVAELCSCFSSAVQQKPHGQQ